MTIASLRRQTTTKVLNILDRDHDGALEGNSLPNSTLFRGPFGVLNFKLDSALPHDQRKTGIQQAMPPEHEPVALWPISNVSTSVPANHDTQKPGSINTDPSGHPLSPTFSLNEGVVTNDGVSESPLEIPLNTPVTISPSVELGLCTIPVSPLSSTNSPSVPDRAPELLRYFKGNISLLSFPLTGSPKCPWQTVYLPSAEKTYAELLLYQTASHAGVCLFYSLLAASCLHLSSGGELFVDLNKDGKTYKQIARYQLECAIKQEIIGSERIKYKEILMALLSMIILEVPIRQTTYI